MSDMDRTATTAANPEPTDLAWLLRATAMIKSNDAAERAEALQQLRDNGHAVADGLLATLERALDGMTVNLEVTLSSDDVSALASPLSIARTILAALEFGESSARLESGLAASAPA